MAASINNRVEGESATSPLTLSSYTPTAGANQKLVVMFAVAHSVGSLTVNSVTYDGNSLTEVEGTGFVNDTSAYIFEIDEPTALAASGDIVITVTSSDTLDGIKAQALTLLGVKAGTPANENRIWVRSSTAVSSLSGTILAAGDNSVFLSVLAIEGTGDAWTPLSPLTTSASDNTGGGLSAFFADDILADGSGNTTVQWDDDAGTNNGVATTASFAAQGPGGDVKVSVQSAALSTSGSGTTDFTKSGFGTPKACLVLLTLDPADDTGISSSNRASIGLSTFSSNYCISHQDEHASAKVDCDAFKSWDDSYILLNTAGSVEIEGGASTIIDGVRLTNTANVLGRAPFATVIMFGGADLAVDARRTVIASSQNGTANITHSGFTDGNDKLIFFIGTDVSAEYSASTGINNSFGVCHAAGTDAGGWTFVQRAMGWASDHNNTVGTPHAIISTDRVLDILTEAGAQDWGVEVTAFSNASGTITVTTRDNGAGTGMEVYSLALDLDSLSAKVGSVDSPTSGATWAPSVSLGFTPQYVGLGLTDMDAEDVIETADVMAGVHGISSVSGTGEETCHSWYNAEATAAADTANLFRSRAIDLRDDDTSQTLQDHSFSSFDLGGWTYTVNSEDETVAKKWLYWAVEYVPVSETLALLSSGKMGIQNSFEGPFEI